MRRVALTREAFLEQWQEAGLDSASIDKIIPLVRQRHYIQLAPTEEACWSRWGGTPWLPASVRHPEERFLCQIALDELPESPESKRLPPGGYLYFFIHRKGRDKGKVLFFPTAPSEEELPPAAKEGPRGTPISLQPRQEWIFPEYESDEFDDLDLPADDGNAYMDWEEEYLQDYTLSRFYEGCFLLGGLTDDAAELGAALLRKKRDKPQRHWEVLLSLAPKETQTIARSALGDIPFLTQRLLFLIETRDLEALDFGNVVCRYGKA